MKTTKFYNLLFGFLLIQLTLTAGVLAKSDEALIQEVKNVRTQGQVVFQSEDPDKLEKVLAFYAPSAVIMPGGGEPLVSIESKRAFYGTFFQVLKIVHHDYRIHDVWVVSDNGNMVINSTVEHIEAINQFTGEQIVVELDLTDVYQKINGTWFIISEQGSRRMPLL